MRHSTLSMSGCATWLRPHWPRPPPWERSLGGRTPSRGPTVNVGYDERRLCEIHRRAAKALAPQIVASAEDGERARRLSLPVVEAMAKAGLFRLWIPRALGGEEADPMTLVRAVEEVSRADGAAGWCLAISGEYGAFGGYFAERRSAGNLWQRPARRHRWGVSSVWGSLGRGWRIPRHRAVAIGKRLPPLRVDRRRLSDFGRRSAAPQGRWCPRHAHSVLSSP